MVCWNKIKQMKKERGQAHEKLKMLRGRDPWVGREKDWTDEHETQQAFT